MVDMSVSATDGGAEYQSVGKEGGVESHSVRGATFPEQGLRLRLAGIELSLNGADAPQPQFGSISIGADDTRAVLPLVLKDNRPVILLGDGLMLINSGDHDSFRVPQWMRGISESELIRGRIVRRFSGEPEREYTIPQQVENATYAIGHELHEGKVIGDRFDGIVGKDELKRLRLLFDSGSKLVAVIHPDLPLKGSTIQMLPNFELPVIEIRHGGRALKALVATAQRYTFLPRRCFSSGTSSALLVKDIDETYQTITERAASTQLEVGGKVLRTVVGQLNSKQSERLTYLGVDAIIGGDLFKLAPQIVFDFLGKKLILPGCE